MPRTLLACGLALLTTVLPLSSARADDAAPAADRPAVDASPERIAALIAQMGDEDYFARERAQAELAALGFEAFDALEEAEYSDDIEIASRARYLLRKMRFHWTVSSDRPEVRALLNNYEELQEAQRVECMQRLAQLPDDLGLAALCRLVRFEPTPRLGKRAAAEAIAAPADEAIDWPRREQVIARTLGRCRRPAADWLRVFGSSHSDLAATVAAWDPLVTTEEQVLAQQPDQSSTTVVDILLRQQVIWLEQLGRTDDALAAMRRLLAQERGEQESLLTLIDWLADRQGWSVLDELEARFRGQIDADALLLYAVADARDRQGNAEAAEASAAKALALGGGEAVAHYEVAWRLRRTGLAKWSEREYRETIRIGPDVLLVAIAARMSVSEMLHDRDEDQEAAQLLEQAVVGIEQNVQAGNEDVERLWRTADENRARMHYFYANVALSQGRADEYLERLQAGIAVDPLEADILIALYRLPNPTEEQRAETLRLIRAATDEFRRRIEENPDDPSNSDPYNQLAWLVGNTEGDQDEALRCSLRSLELQPETAGYLDTLGRCYYTRGELENAVKTQRRAVELDPHSGLIRKQLELFERELREKQAAEAPVE
jgi:tetratricopeptide (TPR) repeat protein